MWHALDVRVLVILLLLIGTAAPAAAAERLPVRVDGLGVVVRAEAGMDDLAAHVAATAPRVFERIYLDLEGLPRPQTIEIRLVKASSSLQAVAPEGARVPEWAIGVAFPRVGVIAVATRRGSESISVDNTLAHELAHLALGAALGGRAPRWLDEGFAYLHSSDWSFARTQTLTGMAWTGNRYRLFELDRTFPPGENEAGRAYAQAYDFVAFLAKRGRYADREDDGNRYPFREFLAGIAARNGVQNAAIDAFGVGLDDLEAEWWNSVRQRYMWAFVGLFTLFVWVVGAALLVLGYVRRRRQNARRLAQMAIEEAGMPDPDPMS